MAEAAHQEAAKDVEVERHVETETQPNATGINPRKLGVWLFLASECMFFGSLIATYLVYNGQSLEGPLPREVFDIPLTTISTFVLLMSSLTMVLAVSAIQRADFKQTKIWLGSTVVGGLIFLGFQYYEFTHFISHYDLHLGTNLFGSSFYVLTGFHGAHVLIGVAWLSILLATGLRGALKPKHAIDVEVAGLYWHFVDIVWIVIFTVVYLIEFA